MTELTLSTVGCGVTVEVTPRPEAGPGGVTLSIAHWQGTPLQERTAYAMTADEALDLAVALALTSMRAVAREAVMNGDR